MNLAYRAIHRASDKIEPRMARAILEARRRLLTHLPLRELESALERGDARRAQAILNKVNFEEVYEPSAEILKDALIRGAKIAAEEGSHAN